MYQVGTDLLPLNNQFGLTGDATYSFIKTVQPVFDLSKMLNRAGRIEIINTSIVAATGNVQTTIYAPITEDWTIIGLSVGLAVARVINVIILNSVTSVTATKQTASTANGEYDRSSLPLFVPAGFGFRVTIDSMNVADGNGSFSMYRIVRPAGMGIVNI